MPLGARSSSAWEPDSTSSPLCSTAMVSALRTCTRPPTATRVRQATAPPPGAGEGIEQGIRRWDSYRGEAVRDDERGAVVHERVERRLHQRLRLRVQRGGGLVQQHAGRILDHRARDGDALLLAAAQLRAALSHRRVVPSGQPRDEVVRVGRARRRLDLRLRGVGLAVADVVGDAAAEQHGLLAHQPDLRAQPLDVELLQAVPVQQHLPRQRVVVALHQRDGRGLAAARLAHQRQRRARLDHQAEAAEHVHVRARGVGEAHRRELDAPAALARPVAALVQRVDLRHALDGADDALRGGRCTCNIWRRRLRVADACCSEENGEEDGEEIAEGHGVGRHELRPHEEQHKVDDEAHALREAVAHAADDGALVRLADGRHQRLSVQLLHLPLGGEGRDQAHVAHRLREHLRRLLVLGVYVEAFEDYQLEPEARHQQRQQAQRDQGELPGGGEGNHQAADHRRQGLCQDGDAVREQRLDLGGVRRQARAQRPAHVLLLVVVRHLLPHQALEHGRARAHRDVGSHDADQVELEEHHYEGSRRDS
eukprot:scaffold2162_cov398-Prasinococcus_capsulatus_cf.AAC.25